MAASSGSLSSTGAVALLPKLPRINPCSVTLAGGGDLIEGVLTGAPPVDADLLSLLEVLVDALRVRERLHRVAGCGAGGDRRGAGARVSGVFPFGGVGRKGSDESRRPPHRQVL